MNGQVHFSALGEVQSVLTGQSIFLVADSVAYAASGAEAILRPLLADRTVTVFDSFEPNPKLAEVEACATALRESEADTILAVGGGTAMDVAKLANWLVAQNAGKEEILRGEWVAPQAPLPLIAVPTTAGTGSEATHFAVVYVDGQKHSVAHPLMRPTVAVVDGSLTASLPPMLTAHSGLDALCQAIESIWAIGADETSLQFARDAMELAWGNLEAAVNAPTPAARDAMARAAHLAGQAINLTKTTVPHALSYTITSAHGLPHGAAVALTLGAALVFNSEVSETDCLDARGAVAVRERMAMIYETLGADDAAEAAGRFDALVKAIGCSTSLAKAGITEAAQVERICATVNVERLANNPRRLTPEDLRGLLQ
jgi:alcohol dehydrogenase class IV